MLTFSNLILFIINFIKKSLQLELYNFTDLLNIKNITKQAFSKARKKLSPKVFQLLNNKLLEEFYTDNIIKTFKGLRILAIDGSTVKLPSTSELFKESEYKIPSSYNPVMRTSIIFDVLNQLTLDALLNSYKASERDFAIDHINKIQNHSMFEDLIIFDRGYQSSFLMFFINNCKKHFLMRINENFLDETNTVIKSGSNDSIITINAFRKNRAIDPNFKKHLPNLEQNANLQIRILSFDLNNGQKEFIVTSLIDQQKFDYNDIFKFYSMRWNIEECYKFYKNIAEIENFTGKSKIAIEQDFFATIFACNISSLLMQEAQDDLEQSKNKKNLKYEYKINRNILVGTVKNEIIEVFLSNQDLNEYCEKLKNRIKKNLVPIRPNRSFPRLFKVRKSKINKRAL